MSILTIKFGGTSVGSVDALKQAAAIVQDQIQKWKHVVVVVSAMNGITDALLTSARYAAGGDETVYRSTIDDIHRRHQETIRALLPKSEGRNNLETTINQFIQDLRTFCHSIHVMGEVTPRGTDSITSLGERMSARIFAALLESFGIPSIPVDATGLIVTDEHFMDAAPLMDLSRSRIQANLLPILEKGLTPVVTGFISATQKGITTTLGRGGSDYTSAILGACLDASEVWTYTDVDGVMTADPRLVPAARVVPALSYSEVAEMAYFGAKVLNPRTIRPIIERGIPLWVKNTFNPSHPGTRVSKDINSQPGKATAITTIRNLSIVNVEGRGMLGVPGIAARTFAAVAREGASVLMISQSSSEQSICFVIPTDSVPGVLRSIETEMALELIRRDIDRIWAQNDIEILTVIGAGMRETPGVSARIFGALGQAVINVIAIAQGSSEFSISMVLAAKDAARAVQAIHAEMVEKSPA
ncbi:MAG: aspartate kinase [Anaerolineaceae bacterium]|nr:aspartate kinase [Anaerolineaceae bacterium]MBN2678015.1 aspartate kinase [Anaerolineaceae bacterium]